MEIKKQIEMMFKEKEQTAVVMPSPPKVNRAGANYFICRFEGCGATIKHRRNLVRHWCLHQKAKYYCFTCGYQSINREQITQHHCDPNGHSKFDCDECDKHFTILQHLNRHLLLIHGSRLFIWCPTCRSYFARIDALKKHQSRCHQSEGAGGSSLIGAGGANRNETDGRSMANISAISTPTIIKANKNMMGNSTDRIVSTVISGQQPHNMNGQMVGMPSNSRDENHFASNSSATGKQPTSSIINLNHNALNNSQVPLPSNGPNENLFRAGQGALIHKGPILIDNAPVGNAFANNFALVRNSVISRGSTASNMMHLDEQLQLQNTLNDNRIKLLNSNIILSNNNKVQQYISTGAGVNSNDGSNLYNLDAVRDDYSSYIYRNKKRFGELGLQEKDRVKH